MELIILAFLTAIGKVWLLSKVLGIRRLLRLSVYFDVAFTFILPILFMGTFSGAILAVLSGLWFTAITWFLGIFVKHDKDSFNQPRSLR
jgi:hypothetical protein